MHSSDKTDKTTSPKRPNLYKSNDPPLFSFQITNPVTYFKLWFKRVWANEGIILHLRIKPLTIIIVALLLAGTSFGIGKYLASFLPFGVFPPETPATAPTPLPTFTPNPWTETAYAGSLHKSENKFYLVISSGEAIALEIPSNINLSTLIGRRILASGNYNQITKTLKVIDASDMEILPTKTIPVPISTPSLNPSTASPSSTPTLTPVPTPLPTSSILPQN